MYIQRRRDPDAQGFGSTTGLLKQGGIEVTFLLKYILDEQNKVSGALFNQQKEHGGC